MACHFENFKKGVHYYLISCWFASAAKSKTSIRIGISFASTSLLNLSSFVNLNCLQTPVLYQEVGFSRIFHRLISLQIKGIESQSVACYTHYLLFTPTDTAIYTLPLNSYMESSKRLFAELNLLNKQDWHNFACCEMCTTHINKSNLKGIKICCT